MSGSKFVSWISGTATGVSSGVSLEPKWFYITNISYLSTFQVLRRCKGNRIVPIEEQPQVR